MRTRSARQCQGAAASTAVMLIPNPTQTVSKINQAQSLHIIQTTVSAALSTILWINNLFPDDHFETRSYNLDDPAFAYTIKPLAQTIRERRQQGTGEARVTWEFLLRGKTTKVDKIWLWLDGVCDAIKHGYLATFQITFHKGIVSRDTIAVAYVLRFSYSKNGGEIQLDILAGNQEVEVTTEDKHNLRNMFHKLITMSQETMKFPEDPTISLQLTYNETCPPDYRPMGFVVAPDPSIIMDEHNGMRLGDMDTKYHRVGMSLVIPLPTAAHGSNGSSRAARRSNSQLILNDSNLVSTPATASPSDGSSFLNTQERAEIQLVREMVPMGREVGDTQRVQDTHSQTSPSEGSLPTPPRAPTGQGIPPPDERRFYFDRETIRNLHPTHKWRNGQVQVSHSEAQDIECHCGKQFASMTVQCEICQKRQHLHCHGYLETDVMDTHVCYTCLLHAEPDLSNEMQGLWLLRQIVWVASMEKYPPKEADLAVRIGCLVKDVVAVSQRLVQEKYLRKVSKPQSKKHKDYHRRSQIPPYQFVAEEKGRLFKEYLNPTFGIEKYLHEHPQASAAKPKLEQSSSQAGPDFRMSSMAPESVMLMPTSRPPATPQPPGAKLIGTGPLYGIFDADDDAVTPHPGHVAAASSMSSSTQGSPSQMGGPGPRPPLALGVKRKGDDLERGARSLKRTDCVHSPFLLNRAV
ncbi:DNA binding protein [Pseudogymnoascus destructans]|uniref:HORMA domain-containing protein n=2 Tax=Pseudogymnoascus destructans TaxID=655981 RepID=L8FR49_PSED2|nr:DNA binding protein [Pseudogymnoascus destructans]ELR03019.1 hypothetical protein GMDG_05870 [Pseudogymnoascus destructans 20631-21]OAF60974.2 DNA binding protein [Pseudogymnoascus destructans]